MSQSSEFPRDPEPWLDDLAAKAAQASNATTDPSIGWEWRRITAGADRFAARGEDVEFVEAATPARVAALVRVARAVKELDLSCEHYTHGRCMDNYRLPHTLGKVVGTAEAACIKCHLWAALAALEATS